MKKSYITPEVLVINLEMTFQLLETSLLLDPSVTPIDDPSEIH